MLTASEFNMKKLIWIDIGTHFGQEYRSIYGKTSWFYAKIGYFLLQRILRRNLTDGNFEGFTGLAKLIRLRFRLRQFRHRLFKIFIEANYQIVVAKGVYGEADMVAAFALDNRPEEKIDISKLYLGNQDHFGQGSSIYQNKHNIVSTCFSLVPVVDANAYFSSLASHFDEMFDDYKVMLRLNCEGAEDTVIYAAKKVFLGRLDLVLGSLKDVEQIKGKEALNRLQAFMELEKIEVRQFSSSPDSWFEAFDRISSRLDELDD